MSYRKEYPLLTKKNCSHEPSAPRWLLLFGGLLGLIFGDLLWNWGRMEAAVEAFFGG